MNLYQSKNTTCRICNLLVSGDFETPADRILVENDNYFAVSSIGGFIPGWTLIFSKLHKFNLSTDYSNSEFINFVANVNNLVISEYGSSIIFEHGSNAHQSATACGVSHAHLHIVPFSKDFETLTAQNTDNLLWSQANISDVSSLAEENEYLFCANFFNAQSTTGLFSKVTNPRSQFFREVLAKATGFGDMYDYKRYRFEEVSIATANRLNKKLYIPTPL